MTTSENPSAAGNQQETASKWNQRFSTLLPTPDWENQTGVGRRVGRKIFDSQIDVRDTISDMVPDIVTRVRHIKAGSSETTRDAP